MIINLSNIWQVFRPHLFSIKDLVYDIGTEKEVVINGRREKAQMFKALVAHFEETCGDLIYHHKVSIFKLYMFF